MIFMKLQLIIHLAGASKGSGIFRAADGSGEECFGRVYEFRSAKGRVHSDSSDSARIVYPRLSR